MPAVWSAKTFGIICVLTGWVCGSTLHAQDPLVALPKQYRLIFENDAVRVIHVRYGAHERLPVHDHPQRPTIYVYLTDSGPVAFEHAPEPGENLGALVRAPLKQGWFRVSPGRRETHGVLNRGEIASEFLRVELKVIPLGVGSIYHRGNRQFDLKRDGTTREFEHARLAVDRIIYNKTEAMEVPGRPQGSLLVALSPAVVDGKTVDGGGVVWMKPGERRALRASGGVPAHLLRIELMDAR